MVKKIKFNKIIFSILISLMLTQLSIPAYAPLTFPDYIEHRPLVPVANLNLNYEEIVVSVRDGINMQFRDIIDGTSNTMVIDSIGYGIAEIDGEGYQATSAFIHQMSLNIRINNGFILGLSDGTIKELRAPVNITGTSILTLLTSEGRASFKGMIVGTVTFSDPGTLDILNLDLKFTGSALSNSNFIMVDIQGSIRSILTLDGLNPTFDLNLDAAGTILANDATWGRI